MADKAAAILAERNTGLRIEGVYSPDSPNANLENLPITTQIELQHASVVFVALGAPSQEKWIYENMSKLKQCRLIIGIGGSFDFIAGTQKRAPLMFRKSGLEWLYRLYKQPSRWRRMMRLPLFALNVLLLSASSPNTQKVGNNGYAKNEESSGGNRESMEKPNSEKVNIRPGTAVKRPHFAGDE